MENSRDEVRSVLRWNMEYEVEGDRVQSPGTDSTPDRSPPSPEFSSPIRRTDAALALLLVLVAVVAVCAAFAVRGFEHLIEVLLHLGYHQVPAGLTALGLPTWSAFLIFPFLLGLAVALVKRFIPKSDRYHAVPLVMLSLIKRDGRIRPLATLLKSLGAMLTLGAGGSLGREGPVVLLGGGIGSALGQLFRLRPDRLNTLIAAGAGAAIATAFHAPMTGAIFIMEIVLIQFSARSFALVALACVVASEVSHLLSGAPTFPIPAYQINDPREILLYGALGLLITPLARVYMSLLDRSEDLGQRIRAIPGWLKPALGGLLFGGIAILLPGTLGAGYQTVADALTNNLALSMLLLLLIVKLVTVAITMGSGWPGGVFAPAMFLGAMAGGLYGKVASALFPTVVPQPGAYAVVGMAAMIAGATHAPLTAMTLVFEITRDYRIALPAMLACGIAAVFSQRFSPYSIDTLHLPEHGVLLPWQVHDLREVRVGETMASEVHTVRSGMDLRDVIAIMQRNRHGGYPVLDESGRLAGIITLRDVREVPLDRRLSTPVHAVMAQRLAVVTPDQTMADAALLMARKGVGRLPVVDPDDPTLLVGIISRSDILRAYPNDPDEHPESGQKARAE